MSITAWIVLGLLARLLIPERRPRDHASACITSVAVGRSTVSTGAGIQLNTVGAGCLFAFTAWSPRWLYVRIMGVVLNLAGVLGLAMPRQACASGMRSRRWVVPSLPGGPPPSDDLHVHLHHLPPPVRALPTWGRRWHDRYVHSPRLRGACADSPRSLPCCHQMPAPGPQAGWRGAPAKARIPNCSSRSRQAASALIRSTQPRQSAVAARCAPHACPSAWRPGRTASGEEPPPKSAAPSEEQADATVHGSFFTRQSPDPPDSRRAINPPSE